MAEELNIKRTGIFRESESESDRVKLLNQEINNIVNYINGNTIEQRITTTIVQTNSVPAPTNPPSAPLTNLITVRIPLTKDTFNTSLFNLVALPNSSLLTEILFLTDAQIVGMTNFSIRTGSAVSIVADNEVDYSKKAFNRISPNDNWKFDVGDTLLLDCTGTVTSGTGILLISYYWETP